MPSGDAGAAGPRTILAPTDTFRGVAVTASNSDNVGAYGVGLGFSGTAAVTLAGSINVDNIHTEAHIGDSAKVNCGVDCTSNVAGANGDQAVRVAAQNQFYQLGIALTLAIGGTAGVSIPVAVRVANIDTHAYVGSGTAINAMSDISITANAQDTVVSVAVGAGGGEVGIAGTVDVTVLTVRTYACTGTPTDSSKPWLCNSGGATLNAGNNVLVSASDKTNLVLITIALAGGFVGVGAAVGVAKLDKETEAYLGGGSTVNALANGFGLGGIYDGTNTGNTFGTHGTFNGLAVQATSGEDVFGLTPAVGGGFVGAAGGVGVTIMDVTTESFVGPSSSVNQSGVPNSAQSVNVSAVDSFKSLTVSGGAGFGFVGVSGGIDIGFANTTIQAYIGAGSNVSAQSDVEVNAISYKQVQSYALSIAGGFVGVGVAVSVWSVGTQQTSAYHDSNAGPDRGTWSAGTAASLDKNVYYKKGDVVEFNDGSGIKQYSAKVDQPLDDPTHTSEWQGPADALDGQSASTGGADTAAGGGSGGYDQGAFTGTTASTTAPAVWASGPYTKGSLVSYDSGDGTGSHVYRARRDVVDTVTNPQANTLDWVNADGEFKTNQTISNDLGSPQSSLDSAASGVGGTVATTAISSVPNAGTTATIDGTVSAGGHVHVWAKDNLSVMSVAGTAVAGAVGVGASIDILNVNSITNAGIGPSASVSSGSGDVNVFAGMDEKSTPIAFSGSAGFVSVGAQVAVLNDTGTQTAHVDDGAKIPAGGGLTVGVSATRNVNAYAIGVGLGAAAVGAAVAAVHVSGDAAATVGDVHVGGTSPIGGMNVSATDNITSDLLVIQVEGGVGAGLGAAVALNTLDGTAKATSGAHGSLSGGAVSVTANGTHNVTVKTLNVTTGAVAVGVTVARADNGRSTEAGLTSTANLHFITPGPVTVQATATNSADVEVPGGGVGGVQIAVLLGFAVLSGHTTTDVEGSVSNATTILVSSIADNTATANTLVVGVSVIGLNGGFASATITPDAKIQTTIGSSASLSGSGPITVEAKTRNGGNVATANTKGGGFGGLISAGLMAALAYDAAPVRVQLDGHLTTSTSSTTLGAAAIGVYVNAVNFTDAEIFVISVSFGFSGDGSISDSEIQPKAKTEILSASTSSLSAPNGLVELTATSNNHAKTHTALGLWWNPRVDRSCGADLDRRGLDGRQRRRQHHPLGRDHDRRVER